MAESTFAEDIGRALRQLWDTASEGITDIGQFQGMDRISGESQPSDLTFSDLRELMGRLRDPSPILDEAFRESARVRMGREILAGFTGKELAAIADADIEIPHRPGQPYPTTKGGGLEALADRFRDAAFVSGQASELNALSRFLTPAERQIYNRLMEDDRLDYLRGKADALRARSGSNQRHQDRFDKMQMGAPESGGESDPFADFLNSLLGDLFGGGGGGGGGAGRIYQGPDPAAVRDQIRLMMVALVGRADDALIDEMVQMFLAQDRERVMNNAPIDPAQSVRDRIRQTEAYQRIHKLRPEGVAEEDWLPAYRQVLTAAGIPMTTIDELAIKFAQSGVNPATFTEEGFATRGLAETGVAAPSLQQNASQIGRAIGALIR